jgi:hypothetical protein
MLFNDTSLHNPAALSAWFSKVSKKIVLRLARRGHAVNNTVRCVDVPRATVRIWRPPCHHSRPGKVVPWMVQPRGQRRLCSVRCILATTPGTIGKLAREKCVRAQLTLQQRCWRWQVKEFVQREVEILFQMQVQDIAAPPRVYEGQIRKV